MTGYHEVGCRRCGKGGQWKVFTDGKKIIGYQCANCKHSLDEDPEMKTEPDYTAYDARFFT